MGFGTLFIGYLIGANTLAYPGFTKIFAYLVMLLALLKLSPYNRALKNAFFTLIPTTALGLCYLLLEGADFFSLLSKESGNLLFRLVPLGCYVLELVLLFFLLHGLQSLAKETEVKKLEVEAFRNRIFTTVYYLLLIAGQFNYGESSAKFLIRYNIAVLLIGLVIVFLNAKLFFEYYMWICLPDDADMGRKTSSIPFLDRLYKRADEREERRLAERLAADAEYRRQKEKAKKGKATKRK